MGSKKLQRKFLKAKRQNACPSCLDREEKWLDLPQRENFRGGIEWGPCEMCGRYSNGRVEEHFPVGNEWRRYPWVIIK